MPSPPRPESLYLDGPAGRLEALLETPADDPGPVLLWSAIRTRNRGGTMQNKVAHTLAKAFVNCGYRALRFNFRGVGNSEGEYDEARGELDDALAALAYLRQRWPGEPFWIAGFSFGAAIAIRTAVAETPAGLVSVAPAVYRFANNLEVQPACPWLIVHGDQDELIPLDETIQWVNSMAAGPELQVFPDTGHFFHGKLVELRETVMTFVNAQ